MVTYTLSRVENSVAYANNQNPGGSIIRQVTNSESGSVLSVGDAVTVHFTGLQNGRDGTFPAKFIGTMKVTVSGEEQVFMVLEASFGGSIVYQYVVGLKRGDAPSTIIRTGNSANFSAETFTVCFFPGTLIATPSGERKVEELVSGDLVLVGDSRTVPVKWVGRQSVSTIFGSAERLMPVRFAAGSLGGATPSTA